MRHSRKIFGVGLNKTGTKSLSVAVEQLGFSSVHFAGHRTSEEMERAVLEGKPIFSYSPRRIGRADAYFDIEAIEEHFDVADRQFPGSRFILHTRDLESWLDSREGHVLRNQVRAAKGGYVSQWQVVDRAAWIEEWHSHHQRVRRYFADRPDDLLEIDVIKGDGWGTLAPFLGRRVPERPFPFVTGRVGPHASPHKASALRRAAHRLSGKPGWTRDLAR